MRRNARPRLRQLGSGAEVNLKLADLLLGRGDLERAAERARAALALEPDLHLARLVLAEVHQRRGELEAAREAFEEAVRLHPRFAEGHLRLGDHLALSGDHRGALRAYGRAARCDRTLCMPRLNLALLHFGRGETAAAHAHYRAALRLDPALGAGGHGVGDYHTLLETLLRCGGSTTAGRSSSGEALPI